MAKNDKKEARLQVRLPNERFPRTMFFNRFRVERQEGVALIRFALVSEAGMLLDEHTTVLTEDVLEANKKSLLDYLAKIGMPSTPALPWQGGLQTTSSDIADIINMTFQGKIAETQFVLYSRMEAFREAAEKAVQNKPIELFVDSQAVSMMRCLTETQRQLIKALYE